MAWLSLLLRKWTHTYINIDTFHDLSILQYSKHKLGRAIAKAVTGFPPRRPGYDPRSGHVGFMVHKVPLEQVFPEYYGFPCQS
jgi:hypothetical protein